MAHKEMVRLKGRCIGNKHYNALRAISVATKYHEGQNRRSGNPYIDHPMRVASGLVSIQLDEDYIIAVAILHDILEDCDVSVEELIYKYNIDPEIIEYVKVLTKTKLLSTEEYYKNIQKHPITLLVKIADRCHNVSSMVGVFSIEKLKEYVEETKTYVLPLCKYGKDFYPEYSDQIFAMQYQIESICEAVISFIKLIEEEYSPIKNEII